MPTPYKNDIFDFMKRAKDASKSYTSLKNIAQRLDINIVVYGAGPRTSTFLNFVSGTEDIAAIFDDRDEIQGLYLPNMNVSVSRITSYEFTSNTTVMLLGVGAEAETKAKKKVAEITPNIIYVSLFYPRDLQRSMKQGQNYYTY